MPVPVVRVPRSSTLLVWLQGPYRGIWTHYVKKRTHPCKEIDCPYCATVPPNWKGYAPVRVWRPSANAGRGGWRFAVSEVTEYIRDIKDRLDLVGKVLVLGRRGKKPNGALYYELAPADRQQDPNAELFPFDVRPIVELLYDLPGRHLLPPSQPSVPIPADPAPVPEKVQTPVTPQQVHEYMKRAQEVLKGVPLNGHASC